MSREECPDCKTGRLYEKRDEKTGFILKRVLRLRALRIRFWRLLSKSVS